MEFATYTIPQISISPAPPEEHQPEPTSPFVSLILPIQEDAFRPSHLTPPPTSANFKRPRSPLNPADTQFSGKGLAQDRFEALLNASRCYSGGKKEVDLRKEIALKTHKNKQVERRALFLSKLQAPPSPSAATTPKTPPESPAIFHYRLPSPGLVSPLALFESLNDTQGGIPDGWVEQVDFRLPEARLKSKHSGQPSHVLPSLDQISARYHTQAKKVDTVAFHGLTPVTTPTQPRPSVGVGRLRMPLRAPATAPQPVAHVPQHQHTKSTQPPVSPSFHSIPEIRITTLVVPRTRSASPIELTEKNLNAFNSRDQFRDQRANDMLFKLRRRTLSSESKLCKPNPTVEKAEVDLKWKRRSAPADLMALRSRTGFQHPVLALPGGF